VLTDERLRRCGILLTKRFIKEAAHMKKLSFSIVTATLIAAVLSACGGGGSDSSGQAGSGAASAGTTGDNALAYLAGTYVVPCEAIIYPTAADPSSSSDQGTVVIAPNASTGKVEATLRYQYYNGSTNCNASTLDTDLSGNFTISGKSGAKIYKDATGKPVTANVATVTYTGMTLSKGNLTLSLPAFGATTDMAYVLANNTLYVSKGHRETDGLGDGLSRGAIRQ
jgi:hypothetical protein